MQDEIKPSFAFLVVAFNHEDFILEHLESIKYLVQTHGAGWDVDVIVNDDCSSDQTRTFVDRWLAVNASMFRHIKTLYNPKNLGTCASVNNMLNHMLADRCKLTAGDDVYSFENIFELTKYEPNTAMVSGRALYLIGDLLSENRLSNTLATATQVIYQNDSLLHRFKHLSYCNAPNLLYATECLLNPNVQAYLQRFDVVEDWPLQIAIAREYPLHIFALIDKVFVYYRRTLGSTYIVANQRFMKDKLQIYNDLIQNEPSAVERLRLSSRRFCFESQNRWVNKFLNLDWYLFLVSCAAKMLKVYQQETSMDLLVESHQQHYARIRSNAEAFRLSMG